MSKTMTYEMYQDMVKGYEEKRKQAEAAAQTALEAETRTAQSNFDRSQVTYGALAEQLGQMGLTGSGYSDNLTRDAYATRQKALSDAHVTYANAMRAAADNEADGKMTASLSYKSGQNAAYEKILENAKEGNYTSAQLEAAMAPYGFSEEQRTTLINIANEAHSTTAVGDYKGKIESGTLSAADAKRIDEDTLISDLEKTELKNQWLNRIDTSESAFYTLDAEGNATYLSKDAAERMVQEYESHPWISEQAKTDMRETFDKIYSVKRQGVDFNNDGGWWIFGSTEIGENGNNFSVVAADGKKYRVEYGGEVKDREVAKAAEDVADKEVFGYRGHIYIKQNDKIYLIQKRKGSDGSHYDSLKKLIEDGPALTNDPPPPKEEPKHGAWAMDGLGYGYEGDEFQISVGSSTFNAGNAINAKLGAKVTDEAMNKELNKLATGNENENPSRVSGFATFFGTDTNSDKHANQLVVYGGKAYVFTQHGWFPVENDKVAAALSATE